MLRLLPWCLVASLLAGPAAAAGPQETPNGRKQARAVRIASGAIRLDGRLDEEIWQTAPPIADFVQKEPVEGVAPTDHMEVRFVYDDGALYVGARMYSKNPDAIQAPLSRRD